MGGTYKRGLVLQGGGAKGAFQFGVLQELHEAGIEFDVIAGTSVGALNGAVVAAEAWELGAQLWSDLSMGRAFRWSGWAAIYTALSLPGVLYFGWLSTTYESVLPLFLRRVFHFLASLPIIALLLSFNLMWADRPLWERAFGGAWTLALSAACCYGIGKQNSVRLYVTIPYVFFWCLTAAIVGFDYGPTKLISFVRGHHWQSVVVLVMSLPPLLLVGGLIHNWINAALFSSSPLRKTVNEIVNKKLHKPLFAISAEIIPEYLDPDDYEYTKFPRSTAYFPALRSGLLPSYVRADELDPAGAVDALLGSAALPLGIVPNSRAGAKGIRIVDGGVVDNTPWFPLIDLLPCEQIVVILCEPESDAKDEVKLKRDVWRRRDRAMRLMTEERDKPNSELRKPVARPSQITVKNDPPVAFPLRDPQFWPESRAINTVVISPCESLGNLLTATMNFGRNRALINMKCGRKAARMALAEGRLR
jgi:predicted acylesterase/phospholipase RssA